MCALLILLMHSANSPSGPLNIHFSCLPIRCASQSCYRSPLKVFRSVYNCQISPWQTQLSFWSRIPSLENSVLFASCREISLLLFSGNNFDNCPWASRQIAFQSKHEEGGNIVSAGGDNWRFFFFCFFLVQQAVTSLCLLTSELRRKLQCHLFLNAFSWRASSELTDWH